MNSLKEISIEKLDKNVFEMIGKQWMLVTAEKDGKVNTMTASWGGLGIMWGKNVAFVVIRPQRYTKEFIDNSDSFSLTFLGEEHRETLKYLGTVSGRDEDKIQKSSLTIEHIDKTPYFSEGEIVFKCKKLFNQYFDENSFVDKSILDKWYNDDYHMLYIAEIEKVLVK